MTKVAILRLNPRGRGMVAETRRRMLRLLCGRWRCGAVQTSFRVPQVRRAQAREPRQDREGSSAKRWSASLRGAWGVYLS